MVKQINKGGESSRRKKIIDISLSSDSAYLPQLFAILDSDDTESNKRHAIRALANIGGNEAEKRLFKLLETSSGLMLGDVCKGLGQLKSRAAIPSLERLSNHKLEWVQMNAKWAIRQMVNKQK